MTDIKQHARPNETQKTFSRKYSQVDGQRPVFISIHTFQLLRSVHTVRGHTRQQLAKKCSTVYNGSELTGIGTMPAYEADQATSLSALPHICLDTFLRDSPSALKTFRCRVADQLQCCLGVAGHPHSRAGLFKGGGRLEDVHI